MFLIVFLNITPTLTGVKFPISLDTYLSIHILVDDFLRELIVFPHHKILLVPLSRMQSKIFFEYVLKVKYINNKCVTLPS